MAWFSPRDSHTSTHCRLSLRERMCVLSAGKGDNAELVDMGHERRASLATVRSCRTLPPRPSNHISLFFRHLRVAPD